MERPRVRCTAEKFPGTATKAGRLMLLLRDQPIPAYADTMYLFYACLPFELSREAYDGTGNDDVLKLSTALSIALSR